MSRYKKYVAFFTIILFACLFSACEWGSKITNNVTTSTTTTTSPSSNNPSLSSVATTTTINSQNISTIPTSTNSNNTSTTTSTTTTEPLSEIDRQKNAVMDVLEVGSIPRIDISTNGGVDITDKYNYLTGTFKLVDEETPSNNVNQTAMRVRVRGNSSSTLDKKSFKLKFDTKVNLCGFGGNKDWNLVSNGMDYSLIRNFLIQRLSKLMCFEYTIDCKLVEVYLNASYHGIYLLTESIETGSTRVDIEQPYSSTATEIPFLMELDQKVHDVGVPDTVNVDYLETSGYPFSAKYPKDLSLITSTQFAYIKSSIDEMYSSLNNNTYEQVFDIDVLIDFFIIQELFSNVDINHSSVFFYKEVGEKIKFGPLWDFDLSIGNYGHAIHPGGNGDHMEQWMKDVNGGSPFFNELIKKPAFKTKFCARFEELAETIFPTAFECVDTLYSELAPYAAEDEVRWDYYGTKTNELLPDWIASMTTYRQQTNYIKNFMFNRLDWMLGELGITPNMGNRSSIRIQAEEYIAVGGEVTVEACSDESGMKNIGYINSGDYLTYNIVLNPGTYKIKYRTAAQSNTGSIEMFLDNDSKFSTSFAPTGNWQNWLSTTSSGNFTVTQADEYTIKLLMKADSFNINWFEIIRVP